MNPLAGLVLGLAFLAQGGQAPPTSSSGRDVEGVVDGIVALHFSPIDGDSKSALPAAGFSAHFVPESDPDHEIVKPCGTWFLLPLPRDRYLFWIEGPWRVSKMQWTLAYAGVPYLETGYGGKKTTVPVRDAGKVILASDVRLSPTQVIRVMSLRTGFARRSSEASAKAGLLMPPGMTVGAIYDSGAQKYRSITRPFETPLKSTVTFAPRNPNPTASDVVARIERPSAAEGLDLFVVLRLPDGSAIEPDAVGGDKGTLFAFWYDVIGTSAEINVISSNYSPEPDRHVDLHPGEVAETRIALTAKRPL
jgi:hypothetical protein